MSKTLRSIISIYDQNTKQMTSYKSGNTHIFQDAEFSREFGLEAGEDSEAKVSVIEHFSNNFYLFYRHYQIEKHKTYPDQQDCSLYNFNKN